MVTGCRHIPSRIRLRLPIVCVALLVLIAAPGQGLARGAEPAVARLERAQGHVQVIRGGAPVEATRGAEIRRRDRILTGEDARAALLLPDGSRLHLGADAEAQIEEFQQRKGRRRATLLLAVPAGAFRLVLAADASGFDRNVVVRTQSSMLSLTAADIWVGPALGAVGVLALSGEIEVRNAGGSLVLSRRRQGTFVRSPASPPEQAAVWSPKQIEEALLQVSFD